MIIELMLARLWLQHLKSWNIAVTCEVNDWHSIQYKSFGKLRQLMMAGWDRNMLWKGKWEGENKNSCIVDGTVLLCVIDISAFYCRRPLGASQKFLYWSWPVELFIHLYDICRCYFMYMEYGPKYVHSKHASCSWVLSLKGVKFLPRLFLFFCVCWCCESAASEWHVINSILADFQ
jgi:hypothetical protein